MSAISIDEIRKGDAFVSNARTLREADIVNFAGLSGDFNPLHTDDEWVREHTDYPRAIAHGLLVTSIGSGLRHPEIDQWLIVAYLSVERTFVSPAYPGDSIQQRSVVREVRRSRSNPRNGVVVVDVEIINHEGTVLQSGADTYLIGSAQDEADSAAGSDRTVVGRAR
tara:strand:+ start:21794 stop:22294 length:501 start_codon:yes stop_codon:yes gene_type:complete